MCKRCREKQEQDRKNKALAALKVRRDSIKVHAEYLLTLDKIDCEEWKTLMAMKESSEEDIVLAEEIILGFKERLKTIMPAPGSKINWWGTEYTVDSVEGQNVKVTLNNGLQLCLYWWSTQGCQIIKTENVAI